MDDYDLIINRALLMVAAAANQPTDRRERALRNAKQMIDKAAQRRYTVRTNQAQAPPAETATLRTQAGDAPPGNSFSPGASTKPNRAARSRPPRTSLIITKRGKQNESR